MSHDLRVLGEPANASTAVRSRSGGLAYLDEMTVRIADVGTDFVPVVLWLREKRRAPGRPVPVRLGDVPDPEVQEPAGDIRVGGRSKPDCRLVIGLAAADIEHDTRIGHRQD